MPEQIGLTLILEKIFRIDPVGGAELAHNEEELRVILTESEGAEEVSRIGKEILINTLDLRKRVVREIMTPRGEVVFLNLEDPFEENLTRLAQQSRHTRFPLCQEHLAATRSASCTSRTCSRSLREENRTSTRSRRDLFPVPEMMPLEKLLNFFLSGSTALPCGVVVDEYGGTVGIVSSATMCSRKCVGDIQDEFDAEQKRIPPHR